MKPTLNDIAKLFRSNEKTENTIYGTVKSVNNDKTYTIETGSGELTCDKMVGAKVGDTVMVLIQKTGHATVIGTVGGDTDASDAQETADEALEAFKFAILTSDAPVVLSGGTVGSQTVTDEYSQIPDGYRIVGMLQLTNVIGHNSKVSITEWRVVNDTVTIDFVNTGTAAETVDYSAVVLITNL